MDIRDLLKDKTCYIVSDNFKKEILSFLNENKLLLDIHFFNINQIIKKIYFSYDYRAIYHISKQYNLSFSNAKLMIENIKYIMHSNPINNEKVDLLNEMKNELDSLSLLTYEPDFILFLKRYNIVSDLNPGNEFLNKINELVDNKIHFIKQEAKDSIIVNEFKDSDDEISYVANEIANLIDHKVNPKNIHIINYTEAYTPYINKIFKLYNIPFYIKKSNSLYSINEYKTLYNNYLNNIVTLQENEYSNNFSKILQEISFIDDLTDKNEFLLYILKNTKDMEEKYCNIINFSSYETIYLDNHYYFFIGLNNKVFPNIKKDEDYLTDKIKKELGYIDSSCINKLTREYSLNRLKSNSNLFISYRNNDYFNKYLKSDLIEEITSFIEKKSVSNQFSIEYDKLRLAKELDSFYKYNSKTNLLNELLTKVRKDDYKTYDNSYIKVDSDYYLNNIANNKISVSYSSFEKFNECNYKYYLDSILKENTDNFNTYIGSLFHFILEHIYDNDFNFDKCLSEYQSEYVVSNKEKLFLESLLEDFKIKVSIILEQYNKSDYKTVKKEENISIYIKSKASVKITGFIDKIMFDNNNAYVVDYKTGENKLTLDYLDYGLKCQLPFYFYLLKNSKEYADIFLVGCYLQVINFKIKNYKENSSDLLLQGYTYNNEQIISRIDNFYQNDSFIKGIKPNKNGLGTYAKLFNDDDFLNIVNVMELNINKMIECIENAEFNINPKLIKKKETTCTYCNYKDICFRNFKDLIDIRKVNKDESDMD